ncbi:MAG TPA: DUF4382 domain-containing protein [Holophagaceae bacterium]|nr:DUF4382 domain-containing protein [Holophagaceae bacterium]
MTPSKLTCLLSSPLLLVLAAGGGGGGGVPQPAPTGYVTLDLGADSTPDWSQVVMGIKEVDVSADGTHWAVLSQPAKTFDLLQVQNGGIINLANNAPLAAGTYQVRITWATINYANQVLQPAYVYPVGSASGLVLSMPVTTQLGGTLTVQEGATTSELLMLDTASAVQSFTGTGVLFQPSPQVFGVTSASVSGHIVDGSAHAIAGTEVFAEVVDGTGTPQVMRRAITNASGAYRMDGLPASFGGTQASYFLVAMPAASASTAYPAGGVGPVQPQAGQSLDAGSLAFSASPISTGQIGLTLTPKTPSGQGTFADLRQTLTIGAGSYFLIVRGDAAVTGSGSDTYTFAALPSLSYGVNATRFIPGGQVTGSASSSSLIGVSGGATTSVSLAVQ